MLSAHRVTGADRLAGPLLVMRDLPRVALGEEVLISGRDGRTRHGRVLELADDLVVVQVY